MPRILIVDDESAIRALLAAVFRQAGYEVYTAANGREAVAKCAADQFDAVLSDIVMPEMDGHDLSRWVAVNHPETRTVLMSGFDAGCQGCPHAPSCVILRKPFRPGEALAAVGHALGNAA
jgi:two-component system cell cycle response regulator CpdR